MARINKCDYCGEEENVSCWEERFQIPSGIIIVKKDTVSGIFNKKIELCGKCTKKFEKIIKQEMKKKKQEAEK